MINRKADVIADLLLHVLARLHDHLDRRCEYVEIHAVNAEESGLGRSS